MSELGKGKNVDVDHVALFLQRERVERSIETKACVIDEDINVCGLDGMNNGLPPFCCRKIGDDRCHGRGVFLFQLGLEFMKTGCISGRENEMVAALSEKAGELFADATGSAGDEDGGW